MSKKTYAILISFILTLILCGCQASAAEADVPAESTPEPVVVTPSVAVALSIAEQDKHPALMSLNDVGYFQPFYRVTVAETCRGLYELLDGLSRVSAKDETLDRSLWGTDYRAAAQLHNAGILNLVSGEENHPSSAMSRQTLAQMLENLAGCLDGAEAERARAVAADVASGATGKDDTADGGDIITRAEFAVVLVRLAGREPDEAALLIGEYLPVDVSLDNYAWLYIADAVTEGAVEPLEGGTYRAYGALYGVDENGKLLRDVDYGVWTFGADGKYTTGSAELDDYIAQVLKACGVDERSAAEALEAVYLYLKYNYVYLVTPADMVTEEPGATGWENERALRFFQNGGGTCYGYAAGFGLLARSLGEHAYIVSAQVNEYYAPHGFVVVPVDGVDWIYDVEMEATRMERHGDLALFRIRNFQVYSYWYTPDW